MFSGKVGSKESLNKLFVGSIIVVVVVVVILLLFVSSTLCF